MGKQQRVVILNAVVHTVTDELSSADDNVWHIGCENSGNWYVLNVLQLSY